ncbi:hypothetical protein D3C72_2430400 [compost metagenome]
MKGKLTSKLIGGYDGIGAGNGHLVARCVPCRDQFAGAIKNPILTTPTSVDEITVRDKLKTV